MGRPPPSALGNNHPHYSSMMSNFLLLIYLINIYRRNKKRKQEEGDADTGTLTDDNLNILPNGSEYSLSTINSMSQMQEKDFSFELAGALLTHIKNLRIPGSILIFLPGWNNIFSLLRYLQEHPVFGKQIHNLLSLKGLVNVVLYCYPRLSCLFTPAVTFTTSTRGPTSSFSTSWKPCNEGRK